MTSLRTTLTPHTPSLPAAVALTGVPWRRAVDAYIATAIDSPHTARAYRRHLERVFETLSVETLTTLTPDRLVQYRAHLIAHRDPETGRPLAPASLAQELSALRSFLLWARPFGAHPIPHDVIRLALRTPAGAVQKPYHVLAEPEIAALLAAATTPRDAALLAVMLGGGLRAAEVVGLDIGDVREDGEGGTVLYVRQGKGRKDRQVPVRADVTRLIRAYLRATGRRLGDAGPLFRAHDRAAGALPRGRLSVRAVGYRVARVCAAAGVDAKRISPHALRHTYALRALRHGANVVAVSKLLGHAQLSTTQKYVDHLSLAELRGVVPTLPLSAQRT